MVQFESPYMKVCSWEIILNKTRNSKVSIWHTGCLVILDQSSVLYTLQIFRQILVQSRSDKNFFLLIPLDAWRGTCKSNVDVRLSWEQFLKDNFKKKSFDINIFFLVVLIIFFLPFPRKELTMTIDCSRFDKLNYLRRLLASKR